MKLALPLLALLGCSSAAGDPIAPRVAAPGDGPLVLELFTSQGCSSCPSADALLAELHRSGGRTLAPLAFHVDYWNSLGWADPFSDARFTARQQGYADALADDRVYTPELVVGGAVAMVGSSRAKVARAIADAPPVARLAATATWRADAVTITLAAPPAAGTQVVIAAYEDGLATAIPRGENAGETLRGERVVRALATLDADRTTATVALDPRWHVAGAVAFAQPRGARDRRITAAIDLPR